MKRSIGSEHSLRELKRANSSLFSIATIVEDAEAAAAGDGPSLVGRGRRSSSIGSRLDLAKIALGQQQNSAARREAKAAGAGVAGVEPAPPTPSPSEYFAGSSSPSQASSSPTVTATEASSDRSSASTSTDDFFIDDSSDSEDEEDAVAVEKAAVVVEKAAVVVEEERPEPALPFPVRSFLPTCSATSKPKTKSKPPAVISAAATKKNPSAAMSLAAAPARKAPRDGDNRTGVVFEAGERHFDRRSRLHKERPLRVASIRDHLTNSSSEFKERCCVFGRFPKDGDGDGPRRSAERKFLDDDDYLRVHVPGYMQRLDRLSGCSCDDELNREAAQYKSIYFSPGTVDEAKAAASSLCRLVSDVTSGALDNGFAAIRPPGHHAEPGLAGGYCVINNVAVAAAYARAELGVKKVLIVDWDVHHGNGTQSIFLEDPDVLYFSAHRYHGGNFFPFLEEGGPQTVGRGRGAGRNVNVGWNKKGMGDDEYVALWETLLMPAAREFGPDLVLVSAGFDAADGDLGECTVTPACFARLTRSLTTLAGGRVVCALEGGYVRSVLCRCVESVVSALLDGESPKKSGEEAERTRRLTKGRDMLEFVDESAAKSVRRTVDAHRPYWKCLGREGLRN